ncbi:hypothetical protein PYW07_012696 [Mythimna separata]|uniref:Uncharacterized protein n=1 Tax=Mythimna separata TaxID=271217 RepID=A0AAD7Y8H1_MYTSE|nr:hypothetical protein PYW07_012696 [Mythimna separata]
MKRFRIVDNVRNSVRNPKFGSEEYHGKKESSKKKKKMYSSESEESGSAEANSEMSKEKEESKNSEEIQINKNEDDSNENSFEKITSDEDIPKKQSKKKKNFDTDKTKRKTITLEDTYFMQGNKIFHSTGRNKKKHYEDGRRKRLDHFMPKRYHWDPSEINELGYYWFNGPKGMYPEPKVLSA